MFCIISLKTKENTTERIKKRETGNTVTDLIYSKGEEISEMNTLKMIALAVMSTLFLSACSAEENHEKTTETHTPKATEMSDSHTEGITEDIGDGAKDIIDGAGDIADDAGDAAKDAANDIGDAVQDMGNDIKK